MRRSEAISSSVAIWVISRAAMLSSAAQAVISSITSRLVLAHHVDAAPRLGAHEALALELRHRLAHRRAADAEIGREPPLVEPDLGAAAIDVHGGDGVLQRRVGLLLETRRAGERIDGDTPLSGSGGVIGSLGGTLDAMQHGKA